MGQFIPITAFGRSLVDDVDAEAARTTLGLAFAPASSGTLLIHYKFDDGVGTQLTDYSGNNNHGILGPSGFSAPTWTQGGLLFGNMTAVKIPAGLVGQIQTIQVFCSVSREVGEAQIIIGAKQKPGIVICRGDALPGIGNEDKSGFSPTSGQPIQGDVAISLTLGASPRIYYGTTEVAQYINRAASASLGTTEPVLIGNWQFAADFSPSFNYQFTGTIYYMLLYTSILTSEQIAKNVAGVTSVLAGRGITLGNTIPNRKVFAFVGDSLTEGLGAQGGTGDYPSKTMSLLDNTYNWANMGIGGTSISDLVDPDTLLSLYEQTPNVCFVFNVHFTDANYYDILVAYCESRRAAGWLVVVSNISDQSGLSGPNEALRQTINTSIRNNWATFADAFMDVGLDANIGLPGTSANATYFADGIHLTNVGNAVVATYAKTAIDSLGFDNAATTIGQSIFTQANPGAVTYLRQNANNTITALSAANFLTAIGGGAGNPFDDATAIVKGSSDATKLLRFEIDGFTASNTRVLTPPNANATIAGLEVAQTFTAQQTFQAPTSGKAAVFKAAATTPDNIAEWQNSSGTVLNVVDENGIVGFGTSNPEVRLGQKLAIAASDDYSGTVLSTWSTFAVQASVMDFARSKSATIGTQTIVASGDALGYISFRGSDGTAFRDAASIQSHVDSTSGASDMPGRLSFWTTPDGSATALERVTIKSTGYVGIGTASPDNFLTLNVTGTFGGINFFNADAGYSNLFTGIGAPRNNAKFTGILSLIDATLGGVSLGGFSGGDSPGIAFGGVVGSASPTQPAIRIVGYKWDSGTSVAQIGATEKVVSVFNGITEVFTILGSSSIGIGTSTFGTSNRLIVNPYSTVDNAATVQLNATAATNKGLVVQGFAARSTQLIHLQTSAGGTLGNVGGCIYHRITDGASVSVDGTEDDLDTFTTDANALAINGDSIEGELTISIAPHAASTDQIQGYFAGIAIFDSSALTYVAAGTIEIRYRVIRATSTTCRAKVAFFPAGSSAILAFAKVEYTPTTTLTGLTLSGTNILKWTGIATGGGSASGDITVREHKMYCQPFGS